MFENFTERARKAIIIARGEAERYQHDTLTTAHLLMGILKEASGMGVLVLERLGVDLTYLKEELQRRMPYGRRGFVVGAIPFAPDAKKVLEYAQEEASFLGQDYVGTEHLILGIIRERTGIAGKLLRRLGLEVEDVREVVKELTGGDGVVKKKSRKTPALDEFGVDLTRLAREGKLDPVIGREKEIERVIQILSRKTKNNPVLIGEPGVGKTAIVEGLAQRIVSRDVPEDLLDMRVIALDLGAIVAGTKYRGQFESRMKAIIKEAAAGDDVILFIDELHTLVGAGAAEGSIDAANMLKPALARGEIRVIGATTLSEYRKYIEKDGALERRFQVVLVEPTTKEETLEILRGLRPKYQEYHGVVITDEALEAAVKMADRYLTDKFMPDKAIDLLDEACSMVHVRTTKVPDYIREVELELVSIEEEKKRAIDNQDYERASDLRTKEVEVRHRLKSLRKQWRQEREEETPVVTAEDIAVVTSRMTGIPLHRINVDEEKRLLMLEDALKKHIVGQDAAIEQIAKAIRRARVGLSNVRKPIGVFFFLGPTGVGKTRTAEVLAEQLFGSRDALIRIDMSEYMEKFNVSKLIGAPPGYVGYEEGGQLTEAVRRRPYSVVLFDEMEKAHPDVFNMLLQIMDSGRLTDAFGRTVDFRNTIIIMTSNVGAKNFFKGVSLGFGDEESGFEKVKDEVLQLFKKRFPPEFVNRLDHIVVFRPLSEKDVMAIVDIMIGEIRELLKDKAMDITLTEKAKKWLVEKGYEPQFGARPLRRAIERYIVDPISEKILKGEFIEGDVILVDVSRNRLVFKKGLVASKDKVVV
ncbi:ATP-dependent Clp protease ATP-binding subunit ClpC [Thermosulfidibacter takaii ABI70S6]|uniref:ATP-dependent Clp protease ATP-binding subunit ClpC n=1 Tax=Thermosulfidibacter takaii (strain DSM 17441 / JCM 13301 / NBRC 103674 / ABI70S6) TaxID=1298851 RepID=A0A0S3QVV3_THET7|nr:ATP-dependent Clp protease ATP-binding subunit [Thermosulfidibacter takaii]BAT72458.1 ATP-dependent Clp protease ATP-binding subunit ClpC [Thermosulfidibacter takaii ABI70S6]